MRYTSEHPELVRIYETTTPEQLAELFRLRPDLTRSGLEKLLEISQEDFEKAVPQAIDQQTGLFSKMYFEKNILPLAIEKADKDGISLTYLSIDLDDFKKINTVYGERNGDEVIKSFSDLLKKSFRSIIGGKKAQIFVEQEKRNSDRREDASSLDYIARIHDRYTQEGRVGGGEEFAVILYGINETEAIRLATTRLLENVRKKEVQYQGGTIKFTFSGGIAQYERGMTAEQLILNATEARKYSKDNGKDKITPYSQIPKK